jgi:uncharacterized circularly permuted ATP-grasp superfamily protein
MHTRWYDEAFDADGSVRAPYAALRQRAGWDPLRPGPKVAEQLLDRPLGDDTRILPVPLVIDDEEYRVTVQAGLTQRVRSLQHLFADLIIGSQQILTTGIGLTHDLLDEILAVEGTSLVELRDLWQGRGEDAIRFVYGPDLIRDPSGRWVVIEDNVGCVGGSADGHFVLERYRAASGLDACPACENPPDLARAIVRWRRHGHTSDDAVAVLGCEASGDGPWAVQLKENSRRHRILDALGIAVVDRSQLDRLNCRDRVTVVNFDVDTSTGWTRTFHRSDRELLNTPGTGILGNKALLCFIDDVIRWSTGHEPILPTPPTRLITDGQLPADVDNWVVKTSAGCQGTEVFVLGWQPRQRLETVQERLRKEWSGAAAVVQRYVEPSRLSPAGSGSWNGYRVEIRPVAYVLGWQDVYVSEQPVGKAVSTYDARRLNNISQGACYVPVLREPCPHGARDGH